MVLKDHAETGQHGLSVRDDCHMTFRNLLETGDGGGRGAIPSSNSPDAIPGVTGAETCENFSNSPDTIPGVIGGETLSTFDEGLRETQMFEDETEGDTEDVYDAVGELVDDVIEAIDDDGDTVDRAHYNNGSTTAGDDMLETRYDPATGEFIVRIGDLSYPIDCTGFTCTDIQSSCWSQSSVSTSSRCHGYSDTLPDTVYDYPTSACDNSQWETAEDSMYDDPTEIDRKSTVTHENNNNNNNNNNNSSSSNRPRSLTTLSPLSLSEPCPSQDNMTMLNTGEKSRDFPVQTDKQTNCLRSTTMSDYSDYSDFSLSYNNIEQTLPGILSSIWQGAGTNTSNFDSNGTPYNAAKCEPEESILEHDSFLEPETPESPRSEDWSSLPILQPGCRMGSRNQSIISGACPHFRHSSPEVTSHWLRHDECSVQENDDRSWCDEYSADECVSTETSDLGDECRSTSNTGSSRKTRRSCRLWEFIRNLLLDPATNPALIRWEDRARGTFRLVQNKAIARVWGSKKGNEKMNYEKLSRAMRYYYKRQIFAPVLGKRLVYSFGPRATGWRAENQ